MTFKLYGEARDGEQRIVGNTRGYQIGRERTEYRAALRAAVAEILGGGPDRIHVLRDSRRVAICEVQDRSIGRRGRKLSVLCYGDKPQKKR